ncbi:hypothetical protein [Nocardia nova]|uniref:hypothetical protein n=1 Tax=Nocardia nova TaxID=37330 RepID=UPI0033EFC284
MSIYLTEAAGWQAIWRRNPDQIRILAVHEIPSAAALFTAPETIAPDLAEMRDRMPELSPLWDAIRHEYWAGLTSDRPQSRHCG